LSNLEGKRSPPIRAHELYLRGYTPPRRVIMFPTVQDDQLRRISKILPVFQEGNTPQATTRRIKQPTTIKTAHGLPNIGPLAMLSAQWRLTSEQCARGKVQTSHDDQNGARVTEHCPSAMLSAQRLSFRLSVRTYPIIWLPRCPIT